jgi:hypothetical protein
LTSRLSTHPLTALSLKLRTRLSQTSARRATASPGRGPHGIDAAPCCHRPGLIRRLVRQGRLLAPGCRLSNHGPAMVPRHLDGSRRLGVPRTPT